jgi:hypothetical protein
MPFPAKAVVIFSQNKLVPCRVEKSQDLYANPSLVSFYYLKAALSTQNFEQFTYFFVIYFRLAANAKP